MNIFSYNSLCYRPQVLCGPVSVNDIITNVTTDNERRNCSCNWGSKIRF